MIGYEYLDVKQGAEFLGIGKSFLYNLINDGSVPCLMAKSGNDIKEKSYVRKSDLEKLIKPKK